MKAPDPRLATTLCGIKLRTPVIAASGTFAYGLEFACQLDLNALGGFVVKGCRAEPIEGNPPPRVTEATGGMINSVGLQNIGVRAFAAGKLPALARLDTQRSSPTFSATRWRTTRKWCACWKTTPGWRATS